GFTDSMLLSKKFYIVNEDRSGYGSVLYQSEFGIRYKEDGNFNVTDTSGMQDVNLTNGVLYIQDNDIIQGQGNQYTNFTVTLLETNSTYYKIRKTGSDGNTSDKRAYIEQIDAQNYLDSLSEGGDDKNTSVTITDENQTVNFVTSDFNTSTAQSIMVALFDNSNPSPFNDEDDNEVGNIYILSADATFIDLKTATRFNTSHVSDFSTLGDINTSKNYEMCVIYYDINLSTLQTQLQEVAEWENDGLPVEQSVLGEVEYKIGTSSFAYDAGDDFYVVVQLNDDGTLRANINFDETTPANTTATIQVGSEDNQSLKVGWDGESTSLGTVIDLAGETLTVELDIDSTTYGPYTSSPMPTQDEIDLILAKQSNIDNTIKPKVIINNDNTITVDFSENIADMDVLGYSWYGFDFNINNNYYSWLNSENGTLDKVNRTFTFDANKLENYNAGDYLVLNRMKLGYNAGPVEVGVYVDGNDNSGGLNLDLNFDTESNSTVYDESYATDTNELLGQTLYHFNIVDGKFDIQKVVFSSSSIEWYHFDTMTMVWDNLPFIKSTQLHLNLNNNELTTDYAKVKYLGKVDASTIDTNSIFSASAKAYEMIWTTLDSNLTKEESGFDISGINHTFLFDEQGATDIKSYIESKVDENDGGYYDDSYAIRGNVILPEGFELGGMNSIYIEAIDKYTGMYLRGTEVDAGGSYALFLPRVEDGLSKEFIIKFNINTEDGEWKEYFIDFGIDKTMADSATNVVPSGSGDETRDRILNGFDVIWEGNAPNVNGVEIYSGYPDMTLNINLAEQQIESLTLNGIIAIEDKFTIGNVCKDLSNNTLHYDNECWDNPSYENIGYGGVYFEVIDMNNTNNYIAGFGELRRNDKIDDSEDTTSDKYNYKVKFSSEGNYLIKINLNQESDGKYSWEEYLLDFGNDNAVGGEADNADKIVSAK
ncbi:MAG: hypothetical protein KAJ49_02775, partial [Arcobacteraceae bacterium]|nr:hypothetical protein [Arcobacteraceae bacterium]